MHQCRSNFGPPKVVPHRCSRPPRRPKARRKVGTTTLRVRDVKIDVARRHDRPIEHAYPAQQRDPHDFDSSAPSVAEQFAGQERAESIAIGSISATRASIATTTPARTKRTTVSTCHVSVVVEQAGAEPKHLVDPERPAENGLHVVLGWCRFGWCCRRLHWRVVRALPSPSTSTAPPRARGSRNDVIAVIAAMRSPTSSWWGACTCPPQPLNPKVADAPTPPSPTRMERGMRSQCRRKAGGGTERSSGQESRARGLLGFVGNEHLSGLALGDRGHEAGKGRARSVQILLPEVRWAGQASHVAACGDHPAIRKPASRGVVTGAGIASSPARRYRIMPRAHDEATTRRAVGAAARTGEHVRSRAIRRTLHSRTAALGIQRGRRSRPSTKQ